ncbi:MAG: ABC transporter substrate-binding protein [Burkholderiales bacterium]|nr:ABC transporter substrate-binding protein [Burkholderiales bacterium]
MCALATPAFGAADPAKVLRITFEVAESGFDPVRVSDNYSATVNEAIFERLLTYDYLARPARLAPMTAEAMPEVADGGRTYTFRLRRGIHFTPDPAFGGHPRELVAQDYVYTFMRFLDPKNRAPYAFLLEGKIEGLDKLAAAAKQSGRFDYDARLADLEAVDRYTLRIRLARPDFNFPYIVAHTSFGAVAREVIEAYSGQTDAHPVGTGAYQLKQWKRASKIVLEANPGYRGFTWDFTGNNGDAWDAALIDAMKGRSMPQIGRVEISIMEEFQSQWLAFRQQQIDLLNLPSTFRTDAFGHDDRLKPEFVDQRVSVYSFIAPEIIYAYFNMLDPLVGGFARDKIALRRAMILGYRLEEDINVIRRRMAVVAEMPVPVGVVGHDPAYRSINQRDPALANRLLDHFGYAKGKDGYRTTPDGKPLVVRYANSGSVVDREHGELWKKSMDAIGINLQVDVAPFGENLKAAKACKLMMWESAWGADYPDGDNFMQLLYGPNTGQSNNGCYQSAAFDAFYEKSRTLPDSPERNRLFLEMSRQMEVDGAWSLHLSRERRWLIRPWVRGFKRHPILHAEWQYMDIER